jgi:hypothetical protein
MLDSFVISISRLRRDLRFSSRYLLATAGDKIRVLIAGLGVVCGARKRTRERTYEMSSERQERLDPLCGPARILVGVADGPQTDTRRDGTCRRGSDLHA